MCVSVLMSLVLLAREIQVLFLIKLHITLPRLVTQYETQDSRSAVSRSNDVLRIALSMVHHRTCLFRTVSPVDEAEPAAETSFLICKSTLGEGQVE